MKLTIDFVEQSSFRTIKITLKVSS